jgi:RNA polymerase sigma factor (sigma-70 family)
MKTTSLDDLLDKLCGGDEAAAAQVFMEYEPYLRKVVRRLLPNRLRPKFDSVDIVQSAWGDLLTGFRGAGWRFTNANQLRGFLVKVTRNRFLDRLRQHDRILAHEEPPAERDLDQMPENTNGTPSQQFEADTLWQLMLELCPVEHQAMLVLKRQGASMEEIVAATGLHPGSIRRILRNLASQVANATPPSEDTP